MPRAPKSASGAAKKPRAPKGHKLAEKFPNGETLRDPFKKNWKVGDVIGQGGFGLIYLASDGEAAKVGPNAEYVIKIEPLGNGPLFCELHFYQRVAKPDFIDTFTKTQKLKYLGVPRYVSSGRHTFNGNDYRFMIMERFSTDLQKIFENNGKIFSEQTVFSLALRLIDALEYIHDNSYIHADVKAANCLLGYKQGKVLPDTVYLVDYGLATKYVNDGVHKEYKEDPRKAHDGTIEFTSIDAHKGVASSRRADMEILGYCLLQWLCGRLPWEDRLTDPNYVRDSKIKYMSDIPSLMKKCFPQGKGPAEISSYLTMVKNLKYEERPNYNKMRDVFTKGLSRLGVKDTWKLHLPLSGPSKVAASPKVTRKPATPKATTQRGRPATAASRPATAKTTTPRGRVATPSTGYRSSPAGGRPATAGSRMTSRPMVASPEPGSSRPTSSRALGYKSAKPAVTSPRVASPTSNGVSPGKRAHSSSSASPAPKKRKMVRRKNVQLTEMACQTSPGLKKNR